MGQLEGQQVEIFNCHRKPALNSRVGRLLSFDTTEGVCRVSLAERDGGRRTHAIPPAAVRPLHAGGLRGEAHLSDASTGGTSPSGAIFEGDPTPLRGAPPAVANADEGARWLLQKVQEVSSAAIKRGVDALAPLSLADLVASLIRAITDLNAPVDLDASSGGSGAICERHHRLVCQLLCVAAEYDEASAVKMLLDVRESWLLSLQSVDDDQRSALWHASANGNARLLKLLLSQGAAFNRFDTDGFSPLGVACQEGNWRCAELLLQVRAEVEGAFSSSTGQDSAWNSMACTPLMAACDSGEAAVTRAGIQHHA